MKKEFQQKEGRTAKKVSQNDEEQPKRKKEKSRRVKSGMR